MALDAEAGVAHSCTQVEDRDTCSFPSLYPEPVDHEGEGGLSFHFSFQDRHVDVATPEM